MVRIPAIQGETWFNSKPLSPEDFKDKVVLFDFWTYSCVNCVRTLPYIRSWWEKYKDKGLVIIGIHTPEFEFEKDPANVEQAVKDLDVTWPVVLDNEYINWNSFANRFWPAKYLADKNGKIVWHHFGEGSYKETEVKIRELLGLDTVLPDPIPEHDHGAVCFIPTPETYCGYTRGELANVEGYHRDVEFIYEKPAIADISVGNIALAGQFYAAPEYVESRSEGAELILRFHATEVNLVLHPLRRKSEAAVSFEVNSKAPPNQLQGSDVLDDGSVVIDKPRMYNLLRANDLVEGTITIRALTGNFQAYAFTFSGCEH